MISLFCGDSNPLDCQVRSVFVESDFFGPIFMDLTELLHDYLAADNNQTLFYFNNVVYKVPEKSARISFLHEMKTKIKLVGCG